MLDVKTVHDLEENKCTDFIPWTYQQYEDVGCSGCYHYFLFSDGGFECELNNLIGYKTANSKEFGITELVVLIENGCFNTEENN